MTFHIADLVLPPRAVAHKVNSQDDPYHENHRLEGDILLRKVSRDKRSGCAPCYFADYYTPYSDIKYTISAIWNSITSFLQTRSKNISKDAVDSPWCLLFAKDPSSLESTIVVEDQSASLPNQMNDLQKRLWLSRIRICYTPTSHHLRAMISALHIKQDTLKMTESLLPTLGREHPDTAPSLLAVYNLLEILEDESETTPSNYEYGNSNQITRHDDLMHMLAGLSELIEYFKSIPSSECHLILYDTILQHNYSAGIEHQVVIPVPMELSQEHKTLNTIFQAWTDWTVESELVALPYDEDAYVEDRQIGKNCVSLVAIPSRRATATEDLHWTFEV
ncbi:hypothetical protein Unana1_01788 [Umbelopsis nana]